MSTRLNLDGLTEVTEEDYNYFKRNNTAVHVWFNDGSQDHYYIQLPNPADAPQEPDLPEQPQEIGAILRFTLSFKKDHRGRLYRFAAIQGKDGRWFWTGHSCPEAGVSWPDLIAYLREHHHRGYPYYDIIWPVPQMKRVQL